MNSLSNIKSRNDRYNYALKISLPIYEELFCDLRVWFDSAECRCLQCSKILPLWHSFWIPRCDSICIEYVNFSTFWHSFEMPRRSDIHLRCLDTSLDTLIFIRDASIPSSTLWHSSEISRCSDIHSGCLDVIAPAPRYKSLARMSVWVENLISSTQDLLFFYIYTRYISAFDWSLQWPRFTEADSCRHFFQFCCLAIVDSLVYFKMRLLRSITYTFIVKLSHSKSQSTKIGSCESTKILQILISIFLHI